MTWLNRIFAICLSLFICTACNYITFTPRSKRNIHKAQPSLLLLEKIVDFRIEQFGWPGSKEDFMNKDIKYYKAFEGFPYNYTRFKIIDSNKMVFYFSGHTRDDYNFSETGLVDLNSYNGRVTFYKENQKFVWKLTMK